MSEFNQSEQLITTTLKENYMPYAMSVIISRAIPEIDGLKPSHRKLLYTMYKMNLLTGQRTKSSNVVGQTMKLNPHGDQAIYDTLVRLTKGNASLLHPFIDSKGNFGKKYSRDMASAAPRYTEVKLDSFSGELFNDIDKDNVDFIDNYDGTMKEPTLLPVTFPNILANPNLGIAVGMASNICSFNLRELCNTTIALIKDKNYDLTETLIAPDFPGGGQIIYSREEMREIYDTGRGSFKIRAKYRYDKKSQCIEIYEIPYTTTVEIIMDKIIELIKAGKIKEISDVRDETDLGGLKLTIDIKRGVDPDKLMTFLFSKTPLEDSFSCNFNILINNAPQVLGVKTILFHWLDFRTQCIKRRISFDIKKKTSLLHLLYGLRKILLDIDKAIVIIRNTELDQDVIPNLMKGFDIDQEQATFVAEIKLRNLNKEYIVKKISDIDSLEKELDKLSYSLEHDKEIKKIIVTELENIASKYGIDRQSEIVKVGEIELYEENSYVENYNLKIFLTKGNYLKKISLVSLRSSADQKLKEDDEIISEFETCNKADLILFSDRACAYKLKIYDIPDCKASSLGEYLPNLLELEDGEKIVQIVATEDYEGIMLFGFDSGKVAKVSLKSYETKTNRKKLINAYSDSKPLVGCLFIPEETDICVQSSNARVLVFNSSQINIKATRDTIGVSVLSLKKNTSMISINLAEASGLEDPKKYQIKNLPAAGFFLKAADRPVQTSLFEDDKA
ncbi:MAG: DNA gyrase subunit A [Bacillota bacterium]|nr:DNA gyrase subunit A [Bacillota bacterium]